MTANPSDQQARCTLEGTLERVIYCNEETAWSVVRLAVPGRRTPVTAVGNLVGVQPGEGLRLQGMWVTDPKYGEQFRVESYLTLMPSTLVGIEKYLGSGMVEGLGPAIAARLVEHFQLDTLEVIDRHPERLTEVEGIGPVRSRSIQRAWVEQQQIKDVMVFLQTHGVSTTYGIKIFKQYGPKAVARVRSNPYRLAIDIFGIGFKTADKIAANLGISPQSPQRAEAAVLHALKQARDDGHVYLPRDHLVHAALSLLQLDEAPIEQAIASLTQDAHIVVDARSDGPAAIYLKALHTAEQGASEHLLRLVATPPSAIDFDIREAISSFEREKGISLAPQQREALRRAPVSKALIITGGPGTGKTTIVNGIIHVLTRKNRQILLCAPTGRAAKRLADATHREARTIHRLLEFAPKTQSFDRNPHRPLDADVLIVDEMSMVDTELWFHLIKAVPPSCQIVLVGDIDQLPSVGPGCVLKDLIDSGITNVVTLTEIFRQAEQSLIVVNAHRINTGQMISDDDIAGSDRLRDFYFIEREDPEQVLATIKELVASRIPKKFGLNAVEGIQVLTPMRRGLLGTANLNAELQALLNPSGQELARGGHVLRVGDKVMQIRNNYDLEVFNGDLGCVSAIETEQRCLRVAYDDRMVSYDYTNLDELALAYACSIHKSQGSEFPAVVIALHTQHYAMLRRNLLYTGITRGQRLVVLVGSRKAVAIATKAQGSDARFTRLAERLRLPDAL